MNNFISQLEIKNFKSIKELKLGCKRVNVFIGKPNVGKSNILEAIGLLNPKMIDSVSAGKKTLRFETLSELNYDNDLNNSIYIGATIQKSWYEIVNIKFDNDNDKFKNGNYLIYQKRSFGEHKTDNRLEESGSERFSLSKYESINEAHLEFKLEGKKIVDDNSRDLITLRDLLKDLDVIKKYEFKEESLKNEYFDFGSLMTSGENIFEVVTRIDSLKQKIVELFKNDYGLQFVFSKVDKKFFVQKLIDGYIYQYPYSSVADTFQRFIFYLAAIESNTNSSLIFEEPEVHSFPPYVKELAERIVSKEDNQFFISTHSPYMLQTLVEELDDTELNVVLTYYKDYQTHVKVLSAAELREVQDYSIDVFFNLNKFEPNA